MALELDEAIQELEEGKKALLTLIPESCSPREKEGLKKHIEQCIIRAEANLKELYSLGFSVGVDFTPIKEFEFNNHYIVLRYAVIEHTHRPYKKLDEFGALNS